MPDWLTESNPSLYFLLAVIAIGCATAWWRTRQRNYAVATGVALALMAGAYLFHQLIESDREQMARKVTEISAAVRARQLDGAFRQIAESFRYGGADKKAFRAFAERMQQTRSVDEFTAWDFEPGPTSRESKKGELSFRFIVRGNFGQTSPSYFAKTQWVYDADGEWRLQGFDLFDAINDSKTPLRVPGLER